jgi:hypothetical protein
MKDDRSISNQYTAATAMPIYNKYINGHRFLWVNDHNDDYYSSADVAYYLRWDKRKVDERLRLVNDVDWIEWDELNILISSLTLNDDGTRPFQYDDYPSELVFLTKEGVETFVEKQDDVLALMLSDLCYMDNVPFGEVGHLFTLKLGESYERTVKLLRLRVVVQKSGSVYTNAGNLTRKLPSHLKRMLNDDVKPWSKICKAKTVKRYDCNTWVSYKKTNSMLVNNTAQLSEKLKSITAYAMGLVNVNLNSITELVDMCKYGYKQQVVGYVKKIQYTNYALKSSLRSIC